jgi:hypothetical protein
VTVESNPAAPQCQTPPPTPQPVPAPVPSPTPPIPVDCEANPDDPLCPKDPPPLDCTENPNDPRCPRGPLTPQELAPEALDDPCLLDNTAPGCPGAEEVEELDQGTTEEFADPYEGFTEDMGDQETDIEGDQGDQGDQGDSGDAGDSGE